MRALRSKLIIFFACAFLCALAARAQDDSPSLGDVARQARQQKQQKDAQAKPAASADASTANAENKDAQDEGAQANDATGKDAQAKAAQPTDAAAGAQPHKTPHVITNDEIPSHIGPTSTTPSSRPSRASYPQPADEESGGKAPASSWTSQIQGQKQRIEQIKSDIDRIGSSIQYAGGNCVSGCVQWNERQKQKQDQVDSLKVQLEQEQQRLDELQDQCGRQGYGTSVCDP